MITLWATTTTQPVTDISTHSFKFRPITKRQHSNLKNELSLPGSAQNCNTLKICKRPVPKGSKYP